MTLYPEKGKIIPSELMVVAHKRVEASVKEDLKIPDPDTDRAISTIKELIKE